MSDIENQSQSGLQNTKTVTNASRGAIKAGKAIAKKASKSKAVGIMKMLLETIGPQGLFVLGGIFVAILIILIIISAINPSTLFNDGSQKINKMTSALRDGYSSVIRNSQDYVLQYVNSNFNCKAGTGDITFKNNEFIISSDYCEITAKYTPDVKEYAQLIDAHATAVNSTIQIFELDENSAQLTENDAEKEIDDAIVSPNDNGEMQLTHYGKNRIDDLNSEYADNQGAAYYMSLYFHARSIFNVNHDMSLIDAETYKAKKPKDIKVCYVTDNSSNYNKSTSRNKKEVSCNSFHEEEEIKTIYLDATFGTITIPIDCDPSKYKESLVENAKNNLVGETIILNESNDEYAIPREVEIKTYEDASALIEKTISYYEIAYIGADPIFLQKGLPGWDGDAPSSAFNYQGYLRAGRNEYVWQHIEAITGYKGDKAKGTYRQCTQFLNGYLLDTYGITIGGDGNEVVANLVKQKGWKLLDTPAPGSVFSSNATIKYPYGHTGVVLSVHNGKIVIAEGNHDGNGGVRIYETTTEQFINGRYAGRFVKFAAP